MTNEELAFIAAMAYVIGLSTRQKKELLQRYANLINRTRLLPAMFKQLEEHENAQSKK